LASRLYLNQLYQQAADNRGYPSEEKYGDFYQLLTLLTDKGIYSSCLLNTYTVGDITYFANKIEAERDLLFNYLGLYTFATRYLATDHEKNIYELPQERWMIIAMYLMQDEEPSKRRELVIESYWALSHLYMTVATPTMNNAGKTHGQLSSCFIDTVDDSLQSIYDSNTDIAKLSKNGGGIGVYMGKIRARGSSIKGFKGMSSGVVPWIKQLNNTDERMRAHDIFTGVTLPDYFMEQVDARGDWYLFDPHEVKQVMGFSLEDFYDEKKGTGSWREKYQACIREERLSKRKVPAID